MVSQNDICPVCGQPFAETDDVVHCPDCGAPHHRACWEQNGGCVHAGEHAQGFVWHSQGGQDEGSAPPQTSRCPRCGADCAPDALVCSECGHRFGRIPVGTQRFDYNADFFLRGVDADPAEDLGGVTVRDAATYVQQRAADYVRKFKAQRDGKKAGWNWAAFLFSPFWFFYRKAYRAGALFLGVMMVLGVFAAIPLSRVRDNTMQVVQAYVTIDEQSTYEQVASDLAALKGEPMQKVQSALLRYAVGLIVYGAVLFVPNFFAAVFADQLYKKKIVREVQSMRDFASDEHTFRMLALRRGGVSVLGLVGCYLIMSMFFRFVLYFG